MAGGSTMWPSQQETAIIEFVSQAFNAHGPVERMAIIRHMYAEHGIKPPTTHNRLTALRDRGALIVIHDGRKHLYRPGTDEDQARAEQPVDLSTVIEQHVTAIVEAAVKDRNAQIDRLKERLKRVIDLGEDALL